VGRRNRESAGMAEECFQRYIHGFQSCWQAASPMDTPDSDPAGHASACAPVSPMADWPCPNSENKRAPVRWPFLRDVIWYGRSRIAFLRSPGSPARVWDCPVPRRPGIGQKNRPFRNKPNVINSRLIKQTAIAG
jgi:hypothetical protein